jgi:hypothetical protein
VHALALAPASAGPAARNKPGAFAARNKPGAFAARNKPGALAARNKPCAFAARNRPGAFATRDRPGAFAARSNPGAFAARNKPGVFAARNKPGEFAARDKPGDFAARDEPCAFAAREALHATVVGRAVRFVLEFKVAALGGRLMVRVHVQRVADVVAVAETLAASGLVRTHRPEVLADDCAAAYGVLCASEDAAVVASAGVRGALAAIIPVRCFTAGAIVLAAVSDNGFKTFRCQTAADVAMRAMSIEYAPHSDA